MAELVGTAILLVLILTLVDDHNGAPRSTLEPLLIGLSVATIGTIIDPLTGFALNAARDFGPRLFALVTGWGGDAMNGGLAIRYVLIPLTAPVPGGLLGAWVHTHFIGAALVRGRERPSDGRSRILIPGGRSRANQDCDHSLIQIKTKAIIRLKGAAFNTLHQTRKSAAAASIGRW